MSFFKTPAQEVANKSAKILDVFTKTSNELQAINSQINDHVDEHNEKIAELNRSLGTLKEVKANNEKVISKISKIFE